MGDIVVVSSDGLQYLEEAKIQKILNRHRRKRSAEIAGYLLEAIDDLADPEQDNVTFSVIKLNHMKPVQRAIRAKPIEDTTAVSAGGSTTRLLRLEEVLQIKEGGTSETNSEDKSLDSDANPDQVSGDSVEMSEIEDAPKKAVGSN